MRVTRNVLLLGLRRSGKTSISKVVFGNMDPSQTQYLHATYAVTPTQISAEALAKFTILDFPGQEDIVAKDIVGMQAQMRACGALVFVLDCTDYDPSTGGGKRDDYLEAIKRLVLVVEQMHIVAEPANSNADGSSAGGGGGGAAVRIVDVFLHKADKLTSEHQRGVQEEVRQQLQFRLKSRLTPELEQRRVLVQYHLTSIFDHSVFYAFSLVARRVIPNIMHIQSAMQVCCNNSNVLSYFLFGISRRMFIASANVSDDRRPSEKDVLEYECCSDVVDFFQSMHTFVDYHKPQLNSASAAAMIAAQQHQHQHQTSQAAATTIDANAGGSNNNSGGGDAAGLTATGPIPGVTSANSPSLVAGTAAASLATGGNGPQGTSAVNIGSPHVAFEQNSLTTDVEKQQKDGDTNSSVNNQDSSAQSSPTNVGTSNNNNAAATSVASAAAAAASVCASGMPAQPMTDNTASAVFRFPSARVTDSVKPVYLVRQLGPLLTLVVGIKPDHVEGIRPAIEYNVCLLQEALLRILKINAEILDTSS